MARALLYGLMILGLFSGLLAFLFSPDNNRNNFFNGVFAYFGIQTEDPNVPATVTPPQSLEEIKTAIDEQYRFFQDQEKLKKELEATHRNIKETVQEFESGDHFKEIRSYQEALMETNRRVTHDMRENTLQMNQRLEAIVSAYSDSANQPAEAAAASFFVQDYVSDIRNLNRANVEILERAHQQAQNMRTGFEAWKHNVGLSGRDGSGAPASGVAQHTARLKEFQVQLDERMQDFNRQLEDQQTRMRRQQDDFELKLADLQRANEDLARSNRERMENQQRDQKERMEANRRQAEDRQAMTRLSLEDIVSAIDRHDALLTYQERFRADLDAIGLRIKEAAQEFRPGAQFAHIQEYQETLMAVNRQAMADMQENIRQMKQKADDVAAVYENRGSEPVSIGGFSLQNSANDIQNLTRANLDVLGRTQQQARDMRERLEDWKEKNISPAVLALSGETEAQSRDMRRQTMERLDDIQTQLSEKTDDFNRQLDHQQARLRRQHEDFELKLADLQHAHEDMARANRERAENLQRDQKERMEANRRQAEDRQTMGSSFTVEQPKGLEDIRSAIDRHDALLTYQNKIGADFDAVSRNIKEAMQEFQAGAGFEQMQSYQESMMAVNRRAMRDMQENIRQMKQRAQDIAAAYENRSMEPLPILGFSLRENINDIQNLNRANMDVLERAQQQARDMQVRLQDWKRQTVTPLILSISGQDAALQSANMAREKERLDEIQTQLAEKIQDFNRQLEDQKLRMQNQQDEFDLGMADLKRANEDLIRSNRERMAMQRQDQKERLEVNRRRAEDRQAMADAVKVDPPKSLDDITRTISRHDALLTYQENFKAHLEETSLRLKEAVQQVKSETSLKQVQEYQQALSEMNRQAMRDMQENIRQMKERAEDIAAAYQNRSLQPLPVSHLSMQNHMTDIRDLSRANIDIVERGQQQARDMQFRLDQWKQKNASSTAFSFNGEDQSQPVDRTQQSEWLERIQTQLADTVQDFTRQMEDQKARMRRQQDDFELKLADLQRTNEELVRSNRENVARQLQDQAERMEASRRQTNDQRAQMDERMAAQRQRAEDVQEMARTTSVHMPQNLDAIKAAIEGQKRFVEDQENFKKNLEGMNRGIQELAQGFEFGDHFRQMQTYQEALMDVNRQAMRDMEENARLMKQRIADVASAYKNRAVAVSLDPVSPLSLEKSVEDIRNLSRANQEVLQRTQQQLQDMRAKFEDWKQKSAVDAFAPPDREEAANPQVQENAARLAQFQTQLKEKIHDFNLRLEGQKARMERQQEDFDFKLADLQRANEELMRANREKMARQLQDQKERMQGNRRQAEDRRMQMDSRMAAQRQRVEDLQAMTRAVPVAPPKSLGEIKDAIDRQNQFFEEQERVKSQLDVMNSAITEKVQDFERAFNDNASVANARFQTQYAELAQQRDALYEKLLSSERSMQAAHREMTAPIKEIGERIAEKSKQNAENLQDLSEKYHQLDVMRIILVDDHQEKLDEYRRTLEHLQEHRNLVMQGLTGTTDPSTQMAMARQDEVENHLRRMVNDFGDNERMVTERNERLREQARYASQTEHFRDDGTFQRKREQMDAMDAARRRLAESMWRSRQTIRDQRQAMREKMADMENNRKDRLIQIREFMAHFKQVQEYQETLMEVNREAMRDMRDNIDQMKRRAEEVAAAYSDRNFQPMQMAVSNLSPQASTENIRQLSRANMEILERTQQQMRDMQTKLNDWKQKTATLRMPDLMDQSMERPSIDMKEQAAQVAQVQTQLSEKVNDFNRQLEDQKMRMRQQQEDFEYKLADLQRTNEELARSAKERMAQQLQDQEDRIDDNRRKMEDQQALMAERMTDQKQRADEQRTLAKERLQDQQQRMRDQKALLEDRIRDQQMRMKEMMR